MLLTRFSADMFSMLCFVSLFIYIIMLLNAFVNIFLQENNYKRIFGENTKLLEKFLCFITI